MTIACGDREVEGVYVTSAGEGETEGAVVLLCHGRGADENDLVPLGVQLVKRWAGECGTPTAVFCPRGLYDMGYGSYAWWLLNMDDYRRTGSIAGAYDAISESIPDGLEASADALVGVANALMQGKDGASLVLAGFSQGAILATHTLLTRCASLPAPPALLVVMSGHVVAGPEWRSALQHKEEEGKGLLFASTRVVQSHGTEDGVLPYDRGLVLRDMLEDAGLDVTFVAFEDGHTLAPFAIDAFADAVCGFIDV